MEFDLSAAIAASGPESILLTEQFAAIDATWEVLLEDYSSPAGTARFAVGDVAATDGVVQWPVTSHVGADAAASDTEPAGDGAHDGALLGHIEAGPTGLFLKFSSSVPPEQIERFSFCMLVFHKATARHCIQLRKREQMPPLELGFEKSRETVPLDGLPAANMVARDRIVLEVLRVDLGASQSADVSRRGNINKEVTVPLNSELGCDLGVTLSDADGHDSLVLSPRCTVNDRRQQFVAAEIKKDLARAQAQATRSQRELSEAQDNLQSISRRLDQLNSRSPDSDQEAAILRVQAAQLQHMASSAMSKVRRLSESGPKLTRSIEQMQRIVVLADQLSSRSALHFRILAQGEAGDLVLLQAASDY
jgi:hypothetical protein